MLTLLSAVDCLLVCCFASPSSKIVVDGSSDRNEKPKNDLARNSAALIQTDRIWEFQFQSAKERDAWIEAFRSTVKILLIVSCILVSLIIFSFFNQMPCLPPAVLFEGFLLHRADANGEW